jgi:multidrug efflux system membrane fusion protein
VKENLPSQARPSRLRSGLIGLAGLAIVLAVYAYWQHPRTVSRPRTQAGAPVRTGEVVRQNMAVIEHSAGTVVAETYVQVASLVTGELKQQHFRDGQYVSKGDLLFEIDPEPYQAAADQARAVYEKDLAQLHNAQLDRERYETLLKQDSTSQQSRDTASANADIQTAVVAADKAALDTALLNLKRTKIHSPIDGKTGAALLQSGNIATANSQTALVTIAQVRPIKVSFTLPQNVLPRLQAQQKRGKLQAQLEVQGVGGGHYTAPVDFIGNNVNTLSGTIELRATFANDDLALVPGQLVQVVVVLGDIPDSLVIPRNAVNDSPAGTYVYVIQQNKAIVKPVTVVYDDGTNVAVTGELNPGDTVITEGQLRVDAGGPVQDLGRTAPAGTPAPSSAPASKPASGKPSPAP